MTAATFHKGKQICTQCTDHCKHCQTEHALPANHPHLAAHWLPCPTHPDPEFLRNQQAMHQKPVYDHGYAFHLDTFTNALQELAQHGISPEDAGVSHNAFEPEYGVLIASVWSNDHWIPAAIVGPDQLHHALTAAGIIPPGLYKPEPTQMEKYIADFMGENAQNEITTAAWRPPSEPNPPHPEATRHDR